MSESFGALRVGVIFGVDVPLEIGAQTTSGTMQSRSQSGIGNSEQHCYFVRRQTVPGSEHDEFAILSAQLTHGVTDDDGRGLLWRARRDLGPDCRAQPVCQGVSSSLRTSAISKDVASYSVHPELRLIATRDVVDSPPRNDEAVGNSISDVIWDN